MMMIIQYTGIPNRIFFQYTGIPNGIPFCIQESQMGLLLVYMNPKLDSSIQDDDNDDYYNND